MDIHYEVLFTEGSERDLQFIYEYIADADSTANARIVLNYMIKTITDLTTFPERVAYPKELIALGIRDYRQAL